MRVLVTGGLGYVGSNVIAALLKEGYEVDILDNLSGSDLSTYNDIIAACGSDRICLYIGSVTDKDYLETLFRRRSYGAVIHCAGLKSAPVSIRDPDVYVKNNEAGTQLLLETMEEFNVKHLIFTSSATVYGNVATGAISENAPLAPRSPFAESIARTEQLLEEHFKKSDDWCIMILRFYPPVGCHVSGTLGDVNKRHLFPRIQQALIDNKRFRINGDKWPTPDGTCRRDYVHVADISDGYLAAIQAMRKSSCRIYNLGSGNPSSVVEVVAAYDKLLDTKIRTTIGKHRHDDVGERWTNIGKAKNELNWTPKRDIFDAVSDAIIWG